MTSPLPGWYRDPMNPDQQKWWDGQNWSTYTMPLATDASSGYGAAAAGDVLGDVARDVPREAGQGVQAGAAPEISGADDIPSSAGRQEAGGQPQASAPFQAPSGQSQGYPDTAGQAAQAGQAGYPGFQQENPGSQPAFSGYPGYGHSAYPQGPLRTNPLALTGFILGITAFFTSFIPFIGTIISLAAVTFSAVGLSKQRDRAPLYKAFGVIGLVLGIIGTLFSLVILALIFTTA